MELRSDRMNGNKPLFVSGVAQMHEEVIFEGLLLRIKRFVINLLSV